MVGRLIWVHSSTGRSSTLGKVRIAKTFVNGLQRVRAAVWCRERHCVLQLELARWEWALFLERSSQGHAWLGEAMLAIAVWEAEQEQAP